MPKGVLQRIEQFNRGREPERLALKYAAMAEDPFRFLRGTCHLFYEDLEASHLPASPLVWCCGDLHLENFGTYKGDNRLTYFDLTDFDETCLAPVAWDLVRLLTSIPLALQRLKLDRAVTGRISKILSSAFLEGYSAALQSGKARWLERATAEGMIHRLLVQLKKRTRKKFLNSRTTLKNGKRRLITDGKRALPLAEDQYVALAAYIKNFARQSEDPGFYRLIDAARRVGGTASLGLEHYVLLVQGRGSPNENFLLDLKYQPGSAVASTRRRQPKWGSEAERVAVTQHDVQAVSPALLHAVEFDGRSFLLDELMPSNDRLDIDKWNHRIDDLKDAVYSMGKIVGWGNLRTASRRGAASVEELMTFGQTKIWWRPLADYASICARRVQRQWQEYVESLTN